MVFTIDLTDKATTRLQELASALHVSPEEYARQLLCHALLNSEAQEDWQGRNRRRVQLIEKGFSLGLAPEEKSELEDLQRAADQWAESWDQRLHEGLQRFRCEVSEALRK